MKYFDPNVIGPMVVAMAGGFLHFLLSDKHSWKTIGVTLFAAAFVGYIVAHVGGLKGWEEDVTSIVSAVSGLCSLHIIKRIQRTVYRKFGFDLLGIPLDRADDHPDEPPNLKPSA